MASSVANTPNWSISFDRLSQAKAVLVGLGFCAVFWNVLLDLQYKWVNDPDWSHGPIIPLFSAYLIYTHWEQVRRCPVRYTWVGLVILLASLAAFQYFVWVKPFSYLQQLAMLSTLLGVIILLCGLPVMAYAWVPWMYLLFAIPLPKAIYFTLTDPLRRMAATVAVAVLSLAPDLQIERTGSTIRYYLGAETGTLGVNDACSGMRSTITLCALGIAVTFLSDRPLWQRLIMIASCVPIAVFSNFVRVTVTCLLHIFVDPKYATGTYHTALGLVTLLLAFAMFNTLGWILSNLTVDRDDPDEPDAAAPRPARKPA